MGSFYTSVMLRGPARKDVFGAVAKLKREAAVSPTVSQYTLVCDSECEDQNEETLQKLAAQLSKVLKCPALSVLNHDDDILLCVLFKNGKQVTRFFKVTAGLPSPPTSPTDSPEKFANLICSVMAGTKDKKKVKQLAEELAPSTTGGKEMACSATGAHFAIVDALGAGRIHPVGAGFHYLVNEELKNDGVKYRLVSAAQHVLKPPPEGLRVKGGNAQNKAECPLVYATSLDKVNYLNRYTNIVVHCADRIRVARALHALGREALISPEWQDMQAFIKWCAEEAWKGTPYANSGATKVQPPSAMLKETLVVYDRKCEEQDVRVLEQLASDLSQQLDAASLSTLNYYDELLLCSVFCKGAMKARYAWLSKHSKLTIDIQLDSAGVFARELCSAFGCKAKAKTMGEHLQRCYDLFADERPRIGGLAFHAHTSIVEELGLINLFAANIGYRSLMEGRNHDMSKFLLVNASSTRRTPEAPGGRRGQVSNNE